MGSRTLADCSAEIVHASPERRHVARLLEALRFGDSAHFQKLPSGIRIGPRLRRKSSATEGDEFSKAIRSPTGWEISESTHGFSDDVQKCSLARLIVNTGQGGMRPFGKQRLRRHARAHLGPRGATAAAFPI